VVPAASPNPSAKLSLTQQALERLVAEGRVRPAKRRKRAAPQPVPASGTVSDLVADQRR
jgi:non-canonical (house-cleaning) NTP pyrophosphatase